MDVDEEQFPASVACDSEGDLRLAVGEDKNEILVSSAVMRLVSKAFKVMLGPNFKEGNKLRSRYVPYKAAVFRYEDFPGGNIPCEP